jgi:glycosyltransferase involved in cell wall biosynthesis
LRLLWVKTGGFLPLDGGWKIRSYNTLLHVARKWPTTVIAFYPEEKDDQNSRMNELVEKFVSVPLPNRPPIATYAAAVLHGQPFMFEKFCRPEVAAAVRKELATGQFDAILCDFLPPCGVIPWESPLAKIVFTHNVENRIYERNYRVAKSLPQKFVAWREWKGLAKREHDYLSRADVVLAVSENDQVEFLSWGLSPQRVFRVPTGVDTEFFTPQPRSGSSKTLVFTGSMNWKPNQDGMIWFLEQAYPLIRAKVPDVKLEIVGREPPAKIAEIAKTVPGISVTGWVDDIRKYLAMADAIIVPLLVGSGTRLKIFEAMAMAKATVSTTIGAEGLPVTHGENILLADTPEDFAARCIEMVNDREQRERIGASARHLVESKYGWKAASDEFMQAIETGLQARR